MLRIRSLVADDLGRADDVLRAAFRVGVSFQPRLRRYLALQPDGWWVAAEGGQAESGGEIVGMVGAIDYGSFAYIGLMAVRPDRQGHHLGRRLLEMALEPLQRRGSDGAVLDASEAGAPLYERMGFTDVGLSHELWPAEAGLSLADAPPVADVVIGPATTADLPDVVRLDSELFGAPRERLWRWLLAAHPGRVLLARTNDGAACGYVCVQDPLLGPFGARAPGIADALLHRAIALLDHQRVRLQLPEANDEGRALLLKRGFTITRSLRHMRRGPCPAFTGWRSIYGKGSYCLG